MRRHCSSRPRRHLGAGLLLLATLCLAVLAPAAGAQEEGGDGQPPDPADAQDVACEVVGCEDTTPPRPPDLPDGPGAPALTVPGFLNVLIIGVLGAALAVGLFLAVRAIIRNRKGEDTADEEGDGDGVEITAGSTRRLRPKSAADWAQLAREAAQAGEWDRALRYMHRSGILRLDEEGHVRYRRGRTNGEYALLLSTRSPRAAGTLRSLSRTVEDVQFGEQPASGDMFESAEAGWAELERTLDVPTADAFETTAGRPA